MRYLFDLDLEALLPFAVMVAVASFCLRVPFVFPYVLIAIGVFTLAQPMILTRTFDQPRGERLSYLSSNEIWCAVVVGGIAGMGFLVAR